jgi:hypothetical protein
MSPLEEWRRARSRRNKAAYWLAESYISGCIESANEEAARFSAAKAEMERIEDEIEAGK